MRPGRIIALSLATAIAVLSLPQAVAQSSAGTTSIAGVQVLIDSIAEQAARAEKSPATREAISAAGAMLQMTREHPKDFGYAGLDEESGDAVVHVTTARGRALAEKVKSQGATVRIREATSTFADLEKIKHDAIELTDHDVPGGSSIIRTTPDVEGNRVAIAARKVTPALVSGLARLYGSKNIAVIDARGESRIQPMAGRQDDTEPYYGGARILVPRGANGSCTSGFNWMLEDYALMVTAGHCAPDGGPVSAPRTDIGMVHKEVTENWDVQYGTTLFVGDQEPRGDLALVDPNEGRTTAGRIYVGGPDSEESAPVVALDDERMGRGHGFCTGGQDSGEICGWRVIQVRENFRYGSGAIMRNGSRAVKFGECIQSGDSGGPVYTTDDDGNVIAKAIISGGSRNSGICSVVVTDLWDVHDYWGGYPLLATPNSSRSIEPKKD